MSTKTGTRTREDSSTAYSVSVFAGLLLTTVAAFEILQGFSAVLRDEVFVTGIDYVYRIDVTAWGWWHMVIGAIGVVVGLGILKGRTWANVGGIGFAVLSAITQFMFMPYYPFWSLLIITLDVVVIWALAKQITRA